jgi:hypothetical protein
MAGSSIEMLFWLFACAIFFITCVSIIGSIVAALRAVIRDSNTSTSGEQALAIDANTQPVLRADRVLRLGKEKVPS